MGYISSCIVFLFLLILAANWRRRRKMKKVIMVVLGSGGHTNEMMRILCRAKISPGRYIVFVMGEDDILSQSKIQVWKEISGHEFQVEKVKRPRRVHQNLLMALPFIVKCFVDCCYLHFKW